MKIIKVVMVTHELRDAVEKVTEAVHSYNVEEVW